MQKGTGTPPPNHHHTHTTSTTTTHTHTHARPCAPPFCTLCAPTHTSIYIFYTKNLQERLLFPRRTCVRVASRTHVHSFTQLLTCTEGPTSPSRLAPAHKGRHVALYSLWHEAATLPALHCPLPAGEHAPEPSPLSPPIFTPPAPIIPPSFNRFPHLFTLTGLVDGCHWLAVFFGFLFLASKVRPKPEDELVG